MKKTIAILLALAMLFSMACFAGAEEFTDAADISAINTEAVTVLSEMGIIAGMGDGTFAPNATLTRAQAAKIICCMLLGKTGADALTADKANFTDVPTDNWACKFVNYCADKGIVAGIGGGKFGPNNKLTGFAFGKMLLCGVAGFNAEAEGLTGADWEINTGKLLKKDALSLGVTASGKELNRQDACHLALNFLFYGEKDDPQETLAYKTFELTRSPAKLTSRELYRPTIRYTTENEDVCWSGTELSVKGSPFFISTSGVVTGGKLYTLCGEREVSLDNMRVYRNGMEATMQNVVNSITKGNTTGFEEGRLGDGVRLEAYYDGSNDMYSFILLSTRAAKVVAVTEPVKTSDGRIMEEGSVTFENGSTIASNEFTEADIGTYACAQGGCESTWYGDFKAIHNAWRGEIVTGKLTAANDKTITIGNKTFKFTGHSKLTGEQWLNGGGQLNEEVHVLTDHGVALMIWAD